MHDPRTAPYGALLLRLAMGIMFLAHGLTKVFVFTLPGTLHFFHSIGYPSIVAYLVLLAELGGGILLILGFWARWIALALVPEMLGVIAFHFHNGWVFVAKGGGWEYPAFWLVGLVVLLLLGNGAYALEARSLFRGRIRFSHP